VTFPIRTARSDYEQINACAPDNRGVADADLPVPPPLSSTGLVPAQRVAGRGVRAYFDDTGIPFINSTTRDSRQ